MDPDLLKSGTGAMVGFVLAQAVNLASIGIGHLRRPRLVIEPLNSRHCILRHSTELEMGEVAEEEIYGFDVRNAGRRTCTGVRFQILSIDVRSRSGNGTRNVVSHALDLSRCAVGTDGANRSTTLIPGASVTVELGGWRADRGAFHPSAAGIGEYFEEACAGSDRYEIRVAAFDDHGRYATANLMVSPATARGDGKG